MRISIGGKSESSDWALWLMGLAAGLAVGGWALHGSFLLNWDLVVGPKIPLPPGLWGLGPELPRRTPMYVPLSALSHLIGGPRIVGMLLVGSVASAVVGMARLSGRQIDGRPDVVASAIGLAYGVSPFLLSRAAIGHLPLVVGTACLPWLLTGIDSRTERSLIRWAVVFGLLGSSGAVLGLVPISLALFLRRASLRERFRHSVRLVVSQGSWIVPGLVAVFAGVPLPTLDASAFDLRVEGIGGVARVIVGGGLFLEAEDVAYRASEPAALLGLLILGIGVVGIGRRSATRTSIRSVSLSLGSRSTVGLGAAVAVFVVFVSAVPLLGDLWRAIVGTGPLGVFRESHKFWPLFGIPLLLGVGVFLRSYCREVRAVLLAGFGALVVGAALPGLFGANGRLVAAAAPAEWDLLHSTLSAQPGRTAVFPWRRYDSLSVADGRMTLQPAPWTMPGTILTSADVGNASASLERQEFFQTDFALLDQQIRAGDPIAPQLRNHRVDWVVVLNAEEAGFYRRLGKEQGVTIVVDGPDMWLFDIGVNQSAAPDLRLTWTGTPVPVSRVSGFERWDRSCERGWRIDFSAVDRVDGVCDLGGVKGILWYPPGLVSLFGAGAAFVLARPLWPHTVTDER